MFTEASISYLLANFALKCFYYALRLHPAKFLVISLDLTLCFCPTTNIAIEGVKGTASLFVLSDLFQFVGLSIGLIRSGKVRKESMLLRVVRKSQEMS